MQEIHHTSYSILLLALLVLVGGAIGYKKAKSKVSLITGILSAILLVASFWASLQDNFLPAVCAIACLCVVFLTRLIKTRKFMPAGMLLTVCLAELGYLCLEFIPNSHE